ncbi:WD40 repeat-like protein [Gonapodya prolifera JEL478]|uniref:WD40 repeat-like protein n=1 Tax=Gonapodya prolifera (strain JEL478) TaxID=1344416 RepID=A0A139AAX4_GONPJ|nr:WD40 repeat-like protein [Gonapodya prolifera JEL478]|eukprot:KXS13900.1 WD40 repeat-like protein [Gonapodya prolifera JEL478]
MAGEYRKLTIKRQQDHLGIVKQTQSWWRGFKSPLLIKEHAPVTAIHFCASDPYDFAVTAGARVQIYSSATCGLKKTISRFTETAYGACIRSDGKLLSAGDNSGVVQLFDLSSRAILRTYREHQGPVRVTKFLPNNTQILTGSDDTTVRLFDIASESAVSVFEEHGDYIRSLAICSDNPHIFVSGSYDHTAKLWDTRAGRSSSMTLTHGHPIESTLAFRSCSAVVTAGSAEVKVWDIVAGGRAVRVLANHQKTVTALAFDGKEEYVLSGSLDGHVKAYKVADWSVEHSIKYSTPVLSLAVSPDGTRLVAGSSTGVLSIRRRDRQAPKPAAVKKPARKSVSAGAVFEAERKRQLRLAPYDKLLKSFHYAKALDTVITTHQPASIVTSVLEELIHRDGIRTALVGRDEVGLEPLMRFLLKHITNPRHAALLVGVAEMVLDIYSPVVNHSVLIGDLLAKIRTKVRAELELQERLIALEGTLDLLLMQAKAQEQGHGQALDD